MNKITQIAAAIRANLSELDEAIQEELQQRPAKVEVVETKPVEPEVEITNENTEQHE